MPTPRRRVGERGPMVCDALWIADVRELTRNVMAEARGARRRARFAYEIAEAATAHGEGIRRRSAAQCIGRVAKERCGGGVDVWHVASGSVTWACCACHRRGVFTGIEGTDLDLSAFGPRDEMLPWGFDVDSREVLRIATVTIRPLRAVVVRASPQDDRAGWLSVAATRSELAAMHSLVTQLVAKARSHRRRALLECLRASLCTSMASDRIRGQDSPSAATKERAALARSRTEDAF